MCGLKVYSVAQPIIGVLALLPPLNRRPSRQEVVCKILSAAVVADNNPSKLLHICGPGLHVAWIVDCRKAATQNFIVMQTGQRSRLSRQDYYGREMSSFFIFQRKVERFMPKREAAPLEPPRTQSVSRSMAGMWARSASANVRPAAGGTLPGLRAARPDPSSAGNLNQLRGPFHLAFDADSAAGNGAARSGRTGLGKRERSRRSSRRNVPVAFRTWREKVSMPA